MKRLPFLVGLLLSTGLFSVCSAQNQLTSAETAEGWQLLFDGKTLDGWRASEAPATFSVKDGCIVVLGPRAHLFYEGAVGGHTFRNFELKLDVKTFPKGNSGVYFHTVFQQTGWPLKGYEVQVNNSHKDPKRTAGLYGIKDNFDAIAKDNEWFALRVKVEGKRVRTWVNDRLITDYTEEENPVREGSYKGRLIDSGTIALQGHDPESQIHYRNIRIRLLP
jgi:hypothetical protein